MGRPGRPTAAVLAGDDLAQFSEFATTVTPQLLRAAWANTNDRHRAEDLVQEALVRVANNWHKLTSSPAAFAHRTLVNLAVDNWRYRSVRPESSTDPSTFAWNATAHDAATDRAYHAAEARPSLVAALQQLAPRQRAVLVMRYLRDMSDDDIAENLGIKPATVRATAMRGLEALRTLDPNPLEGVMSR